MRKTLGLAALAVALACGGANAQQVNVKIGVLTDMSGLYADAGGQARSLPPSWRSPTSSRSIPT